MSTTLEEAFNPEKEEGTSFDLVPPGTYLAEIEDAKVVTTKNGNGQMVKLRWKITEGEHENRVLWQQLIIQHTSADAQKFGRRKFKDLCVALNITDPVNDLEVLHFKPCRIMVGIEKATGYADQNRISRVMPQANTGNGSSDMPNDELPF
jgi:hypothetical protein